MTLSLTKCPFISLTKAIQIDLIQYRICSFLSESDTMICSPNQMYNAISFNS